jgi:hypothetical protein
MHTLIPHRHRPVPNRTTMKLVHLPLLDPNNVPRGKVELACLFETEVAATTG